MKPHPRLCCVCAMGGVRSSKSRAAVTAHNLDLLITDVGALSTKAQCTLLQCQARVHQSDSFVEQLVENLTFWLVKNVGRGHKISGMM